MPRRPAGSTTLLITVWTSNTSPSQPSLQEFAQQHDGRAVAIHVAHLHEQLLLLGRGEHALDTAAAIRPPACRDERACRRRRTPRPCRADRGRAFRRAPPASPACSAAAPAVIQGRSRNAGCDSARSRSFVIRLDDADDFVVGRAAIDLQLARVGVAHADLPDLDPRPGRGGALPSPRRRRRSSASRRRPRRIVSGQHVGFQSSWDDPRSLDP